MPTALIRSKQRQSPADKSGLANHNHRNPKNQRLHAKASATTATNSSPTNRITMVPIPRGELRNGIGSILSGRTLVMKIFPPERFAAA